MPGPKASLSLRGKGGLLPASQIGWKPSLTSAQGQAEGGPSLPKDYLKGSARNKLSRGVNVSLQGQAGNRIRQIQGPLSDPRIPGEQEWALQGNRSSFPSPAQGLA